MSATYIRKIMYLLGAGILFAAPAAFAGPIPGPRNLITQRLAASQRDPVLQKLNDFSRTRWAVTEDTVAFPDGRKAAATNYERYIPQLDFHIPLGHMQVFEMPRDKAAGKSPAQEAKDVAKSLRSWMRGPAWESRERDGVFIFETVWREQNRVYRLWLEPRETTIKVSFSSFRPVYVNPMLFETELLHRAVHGRMETAERRWPETRELFASLFQRFWPEGEGLFGSVAEAQIPGLNVGQIANQGSGFLNDFLRLNGNFVNDVRQQGNSAIADIRRGADRIGRQATAIGREIRAEVNETQAIARDGIAVARDGVRSIDNASQTARDITRRLTDWRTAFILGVGGAAGAVVGSAVVNLAWDASVQIISHLYYGIRGQIPPEVRQRMSQQGVQALDNLNRFSTEMLTVERELDRQMAALFYVTQLGPDQVGNVAQQAELDFLNADVQIAQVRNRLMNLRPGSPAYNECLRDLQSKENWKRSMQQISEVLVAGNAANNLQKICDDIRRQLLRWTTTERGLHMARTGVLNNINVIIADLNREAQSIYTPQSSERRNRNECRRSIASLRANFSPEDRNAAWVRQTLESFDRMEAQCDEVNNTVYAQDPNRSLATGTAYLESNLNAIADEVRQLSQSDCRRGQTDNGCDGRSDGKFTQLTERYNSKLRAASQYCPNLAGLTQRQLPGAPAPQAAAGGADPTSPASGAAAGSGPGFFGRMWSGIRNWFSSWF